MHNDEIVPAIFGNCGTLVELRVSGDDATILAKEFASDVIATQLENLPDYELYLRTLTLTEGSKTLIATHAERHTAYPPFKNNTDAQEGPRVIQASFERYTRERLEVDAWLARRLPPDYQNMTVEDRGNKRTAKNRRSKKQYG